jgi:ketol-acid reductoisomerase
VAPRLSPGNVVSFASGAARFLDLGGPIKEKMTAVLDEIRSGAFAAEWSEAQATAGSLLERIRAVRDETPIAKWERSTRAALRIGDQGE